MEQDEIEAMEDMIAVEGFTESPLYKVLEKRQAIDEQTAFKEFLELDPYTYTTLPDLQNKLAKIQENVLISRRVNTYFYETILIGREVEETLTAEEDLT